MIRPGSAKLSQSAEICPCLYCPPTTVLRLDRHPLILNAPAAMYPRQAGYAKRLNRSSSPIPPSRHDRTPFGRPTHPAAKHSHIILLVTLGVCCVVPLTTAYYLYSSRGDTYSWDAAIPQANLDGPMEAYGLDEHSSTPIIRRDGTKYLSYLPHSGVHNQRIALENALTLARLLNRTLLVPPIRLGRRPMRYLAFDSLERSLRLSGSEGLGHCGDVPHYISLPVE